MQTADSRITIAWSGGEVRTYPKKYQRSIVKRINDVLCTLFDLWDGDEVSCECCDKKLTTYTFNARHECGCKLLCDDCVIIHDAECEEYINIK